METEIEAGSPKVQRRGPAHERRAVRRRFLPPRASVLGLVILVPLTLGLAGCTGSDDEPEAVSTPSSVVLQPGGPGEKAETIAPEDYEGRPAQAPFSEADAAFLSDMILHHGQATEMAGLVRERSESEQVTKFAARIDVVQDSEIDLMSGWLEENDYPVPLDVEGGDGSGPRAPEHGHDPDDMPGMLTDAEMASLEKASGAEFDRLFLEGMIKHHEGALTMCEEVAGSGSEERVIELATNIAADQMAEIDRMANMRADL
ncbi:Uncharacterized conserved protein, DUF305 family [Promicromonospora umidemergens]|uniref:DUF305 domain-containing protein n=1 Tax=Promicromonospora umidemergens TaxID=629679 RepID=A0ABP8XTW5_9MICO|nr:DUF305 domain-containing protein [Promicromonospora umidemergens]MCP2287083.1 Uncharacterized conserved protein, DUF305 family [Promicromonospora umidemergens]